MKLRKRIYLGNGKYKNIYADTQKELNNKYATLKAELNKGVDIIGNQSTFKEWCNLYLSAEKSKASEHIYKVKETHLKYFCECFGKTPISEVKPFQIEMALQDKNELTKKTLKEYLSHCNQVFTFAIKNRAITFNPCAYIDIEYKHESKKERRALSSKEIENIARCNCYGKLPAMLSLYSGLRKGEMAALKWGDIDPKNKVITINKSYDYLNKRIKEPKTEAGVRQVPIPDILLSVLASAPKNSKYVISVDGGMMTVSQWEKTLRDLLAEMERLTGNNGIKVKVGNRYKTYLSIEPFGWHDLRHTYATMLWNTEGIDLLCAKQWLGHSDYSTTLKIYTHLTKEKQLKSITELNNYINRCGDDVAMAKSKSLDK